MVQVKIFFLDLLLVFLFFIVFFSDFLFVFSLVLGSNETSIDNSISSVLQRSKKTSLTKNIALPDQNIEAAMVVTKFENGIGNNANVIWPGHGYFEQ